MNVAMKPTLGPYECEHCHKIWYGSHHTEQWVPQGRILCLKCWSELDNYLYKHFKSRYNLAWSYMKPEDIPFIHAEANKWIKNSQLPPLKPKNIYYSGGVPHWMRSAIEAGMVKTNSSDVYIVIIDENKQVVGVETSQDRTLLGKRMVNRRKFKS